MGFLNMWGDSALTTLGFFWMAFWAFGLGYVISASIQVFVSRDAMSRYMGGEGPRPVALATVFGFVSSSCSFAALAATRSLLAKGASLVAGLAFLLASTNLVIELGLVIAVFLSWHFVVGEYVGGLLLIAIVWGILRAARPDGIIAELRKRLRDEGSSEPLKLSDLRRGGPAWTALAEAYVGEWAMVWKDVTVGFTLAGIIAVGVPDSVFVWLFPGTGTPDGPTFLQVLAQSVIGPVAAFFTFIGSMGNIPLAGLLYQNGVSVAGIMAFIFSDLVVLPVLRVNAQFYGWRIALYIAGLFLVAIVTSAVLIHYGFAFAGVAPDVGKIASVAPTERFAIDTRFWLNLAFGVVTVAALLRSQFAPDKGQGGHHHHHGHGGPILRVLAFVSLAWLGVGAAVGLLA